MALPIVAVVGRPNVGKSTLVNRIAEVSDAIVHEQRGVTRDRSYHRADWNGREFMLVDTGGIETAKDDPFAESIATQAIVAAEEADVIIVVADSTTGVLAGDEDVARRLRKVDRPVFLVVNKMDTPNRDEQAAEFWSLGLGQPWSISATHGHGTGDFLDALVAELPVLEVEPESPAIDVAIIGRPNAGKSSLLNKLAGVERAIVSDVAGTTRDSLDVVVERDGQVYRFVDTAGIRRKSQIEESVEYYGFVRAMRAIDRSQVVLLILDATAGVTDGDQRIARFASERGSALIVVVNKWDLIETEEQREEIAFEIEEKLGFVSYAPIVRISALTGLRLQKVFGALTTAYESYTRKISTSALNRLLTQLREFGHTVTKGPKTLRIHYITQTRIEPPGFTLFANHPRLVDDPFRRYLENRMREAFDLTGTPIQLRFRQKD